MSSVLAVLIILAVVGASVGLLYAVRRGMGRERLIVEATRGNSAYHLAATAYAVLLAFVVLVAFESFNDAKTGAETEAVAVVELFRVAGLFPPADRSAFRSAVVCYGRAAVGEWRAMSDGHSSPAVDDAVVRMRDRLAALDLSDPLTQEALSDVLRQEDDRTTGGASVCRRLRPSSRHRSGSRSSPAPSC